MSHRDNRTPLPAKLVTHSDGFQARVVVAELENALPDQLNPAEERELERVCYQVESLLAGQEPAIALLALILTLSRVQGYGFRNKIIESGEDEQ